MSGRDEVIWSRWEELEPLLEQLLEADHARREVELSELGRDDPILARTLRELLAAGAEDGHVAAGPTPRLVQRALDERTPAETPPERVGPYRPLEALGRGGMGSVFLAERDDPSFPNRVALKILRRGIDTDDVLARFRAERQILASLHHPGIATVFDAGTAEDGRPFLVMEYVEGRPVTRHCDAEQLDVEGRLEVFMAVLRAVSHAHRHGVVHRDLKPSNILVTREESHVKLLDFGIAKLLSRSEEEEGETPATAPDARPMTPGFASPEQVQGLPITETSDIYQLGLLLHELLTGARPFEGCSSHEYERRVATTEPELPSRSARRSDRAVPMRGLADARELAKVLVGDLDAIVLRCLQPDPSARYQSVDALHEDIERYLGGRPVKAKHGTRPYMLGRSIPRRARSIVRWVAPLAAFGGLIAFLAYRGSSSEGPATPTVRWIAAGPIDDETGLDAWHADREVTELLVSNLARSDDLQVVRLSSHDDGAALGRTAVRAGVSEVLTGVVRTLGTGELELVIRRTEASSGRPLDSVRVRGDDSFTLVDRGSAELMRQYGIRPPPGQGVGASTSSPQAYRFFIEGLAAYGSGDDRVADRFFHAALDEDSTFALAAYYAYRTTYSEEPHVGLQLLNRASRLAEGATDRERLVIRARWASTMVDPLLEIFSDSLVGRFPADPEGHYLQGQALILDGRFLEAVRSLERAVALDSLSLHAERGPCVACDALPRIVSAYLLADSMRAAVRAGERWTRLQPASARAWHSLATGLIDMNRYDDALEAQNRAATLRVGDSRDQLFPGMVATHRGDFEEADRLFRMHLQTGTPRMRIDAAHWLGISLRTQGRWSEALDVSEELIRLAREHFPGDRLDILGNLAQALALLGSGQAAEAARFFEVSARGYDEFSESRISRDRAWYLTHAGTARAAAGDTAALDTLASRVEALGARSAYGRDRRLHHYLRALAARLRGAPETEVEGHLRSALYSLSQGFSRINIELGESLLRQGRYEEAAGIVEAALRNSMQSNGMYATRTEVHDLLGRIWHAAGEDERALLHLRAARDAWSEADSVLRPRVDRIDSLIASLR